MLNKKSVIPIIIISLFVWSCKSQAGLQKEGNLPRVENVHFTQEQDTITVFYDLLARSDKSRFNVELLLSVDDEEAYTITSSSLSGDIGEKVPPGKDQQIKWNVLRDFPRGIQKENIRFIVHANKINSSKKTWLYIVAGSLAVGAGTALGILIGGGDSGLPGPPGRPGGQ